MKPRIKRSERLDEEIISSLEDGQTLTQICSGEGMPTLRAVQKWRRQDEDFENAVHDAWVRGLQTRFDKNYDDQQRLLDNPTNYDPKHINAMATITRDRSHQIIAAQTRLDRRYAVQSKTEHTGGGPFVVGWQDTPTADPMNDLTLSKEPQGGEARR